MKPNIATPLLFAFVFIIAKDREEIRRLKRQVREQRFEIREKSANIER